MQGQASRFTTPTETCEHDFHLSRSNNHRHLLHYGGRRAYHAPDLGIRHGLFPCGSASPVWICLRLEPVYFDVVQENSEEESGITLIEVVRSNMAQKGTITVEKSGEVFSTVAGDKGLVSADFLR